MKSAVSRTNLFCKLLKQSGIVLAAVLAVAAVYAAVASFLVAALSWIGFLIGMFLSVVYFPILLGGIVTKYNRWCPSFKVAWTLVLTIAAIFGGGCND